MLTHSHLARLFLLGIGGFGLYLAFFGNPEGGIALIPCPVRSVIGIPCPGCGMTRSCLALAQGEFVSAWNFHPFSFFLVVLAVGVGFFPTASRSLWNRLSPTARGLFFFSLVALCLGRWIGHFFD